MTEVSIPDDPIIKVQAATEAEGKTPYEWHIEAVEFHVEDLQWRNHLE